MSKQLPTITINTDVGIDNNTNTLPRPTSSNVRHVAVSSTKKKRAVHKITAKLPGLPRQLNAKNVSDSGGSSADEHDITPHNNIIPTIYLSPAESSSSTPSTPSTLTSTPRYYSLLNNNSASMPDLSKKFSAQSNNHGNNSFGRLKKLQPRRRNLTTSPIGNNNSNNNDGYFSEDSILFQSPVSMVNKFKFPTSRTFSSPVKSPTSATSPTNTSTPMIFRRRKHKKLLKKKKEKSFNIKSPLFRNIMNFDNVAFYSSSKNNKSNLLQSIPYDQMTIIQHSKPPSLYPTAFDDRLSMHLNLESVQKFVDLPLIFIFKNLTEKDEIENFLVFKIENFILYYHIDDNNEDQTWCIKHFRTFSGDIGSGGLTVEGIDDFAEERKENFVEEKTMNQKKDYKIFKDDVFDRFKDVEYRELCSVDEILSKDDIHLITKNETDNMNIFKIQAGQSDFILGTYFLDEKRKFLNTIRFFKYTKNSSDSESDEDEEIDSDEEEIGPSDFIELIEELANSCNQYEDKIVTLRETIVQKSKELDSSIRKCRELDGLAKGLDETISVTRHRSTKEMEETINMADQTTQGIANKLTSIRTRIRDKSEILKQHQQLLTTLKNQVELEKRSSKILAQYRMVFGVILVILISIASASGIWQQFLSQVIQN